MDYSIQDWALIFLESLAAFSILFVLSVAFHRLSFALHKKKLRQDYLNNSPLVIGFYHPFCDAGAGGEKVLFSAIRAL